MEKYKLIVFDLDGTLLSDDFILSDITIQSVEELKKMGLRVTVATGRGFFSAKPFLEKLNITEPMVFSNGAVYDDPDTGFREIISGIALETALILLMLISDFEVSLKIHLADGTIYKTDETPWPNEGAHFPTGETEPDLKSKLTQDPIKIVIHGKHDQMDQFVQKATEILGKNNNARFFKSNPDYYEVSNKNVSKGGALLKLVQKIGILPENVITVGDQENDFEMLRDFGLGIMVGENSEKIKDVTKFKVPSPEKNGIRELVKIVKELI